jgi:hypothetical protein
MEQQNAAKEARGFEEKARAAWAREKELLGKEAELLKHVEFCRDMSRHWRPDSSSWKSAGAT